eukprot:COSAG01_NODE_41187_length_454_cov_4.492958_1_plen_124_part_01
MLMGSYPVRSAVHATVLYSMHRDRRQIQPTATAAAAAGRSRQAPDGDGVPHLYTCTIMPADMYIGEAQQQRAAMLRSRVAHGRLLVPGSSPGGRKAQQVACQGSSAADDAIGGGPLAEVLGGEL